MRQHIFFAPPRTSIGSLTNLRPQGGASNGSKLAPLLVLTRFGNHKQLTKNKGQRVTPFWHNDAQARVTVTFGRRRGNKISGYVSTFENAVLKHSEFMFKDSALANRHFDAYTKALKQLAKLGDDGLSALSRLLDSENTVIRVTTACYLIHYSTSKAIKILKAAAKEERGIAMLAIVTLKKWELGRYLDPASGIEVELGKRRK